MSRPHLPTPPPPGSPAVPPPSTQPLLRGAQLAGIGIVAWAIGTLAGHGFPIDLATVAVVALLVFGGQFALARWKPAPTRPMRLLPGESRAWASTKVALGVGGAGLLVGAVIEFQAPLGGLEPFPFWLRILWHGLCGFGITYVRIRERFAPPPTLRRTQRPNPPPTNPPPTTDG